MNIIAKMRFGWGFFLQTVKQLKAHKILNVYILDLTYILRHSSLWIYFVRCKRYDSSNQL